MCKKHIRLGSLAHPVHQSIPHKESWTDESEVQTNTDPGAPALLPTERVNFLMRQYLYIVITQKYTCLLLNTVRPTPEPIVQVQLMHEDSSKQIFPSFNGAMIERFAIITSSVA